MIKSPIADKRNIAILGEESVWKCIVYSLNKTG